MCAQLSNERAGRSSALDALAEIRACHAELQTFVGAMFDRLDRLVNEFFDGKIAQDHQPQQVDVKTFQDQIDQLSAAVAELTSTVADQRRPATQKDRNGRER